MASITAEQLDDSVGIYADPYTMLSTCVDVLEALMTHVDMDTEMYERMEIVKDYVDEVYVGEESEEEE